jgi:hypothetical protein
MRPRKRLLTGFCFSAATVVVAVIAAEALMRIVVPGPQAHFQLLFFSHGAVKDAPWGSHRYEPNAAVQIRLFNITDLKGPRLAKVYDYHLTTNSYGLIQQKELTRNKPAILFLGDSFTEGQGARPWFYEVESRWPTEAPYQLINGGLFGTGLEHWSRLYRHLSSTLTIRKVVVIFISDDWHRLVVQFNPDHIRCLQSSQHCQPWMPFFGLPTNRPRP